MRIQPIAALFIALQLWICTSPASFLFISCASAATIQVHDAPLEEALDFYQRFKFEVIAGLRGEVAGALDG